MKLVRPTRGRVLAHAGQRGIRLLPGLITVGNLLFGFAALFFAMRASQLPGPSAGTTPDITHMGPLLPSYLSVAALMILLAAICDGLDGRVARLARRTSDFGGQLDSLADMVSFGAAAAFVVVVLMGRQLGQTELVGPLSENLVGRVAWVAAALYVACAALRLARFNVDHSSAPRGKGIDTFEGLPTPAAGIALVAAVILHEHLIFLGSQGAATGLVLALPAVTAGLALLMVSPVRYPHVLNRYLRRRRSFAQLTFWVMVVAALLAYPQMTIAVSAGLYVLSGPASALWRAIRGRRRPPDEDDRQDSLPNRQLPA
jgi:CDP-diacylglycerol--serine O-phosphatidyltransferase